MFSVDEALEKILAAFARLDAEMIPIAAAVGRTLAEGIRAGLDLPSFANSSMDGFAVRAADVSDASLDRPVTLTVVADIPAGTYIDRSIETGEAARIMTGAPMPPGADTVVPVEQTDRAPGKTRAADEAELPPRITVVAAPQPGDYVRLPGEDVKRGQIVLHVGRVLRPADLGVLAGLGIPQVPVIRRPVVGVLSSGDELREPGESLAPGQIYDMNSYTVAALIEELGAQVVRLGTARDQLDDVLARFEQAIAMGVHLVVSSAGVSVGTFDVVKTAVEHMGTIDFWKINIRPGKPLVFGDIRGIPLIGLPGNPVSAMVTFDVFVRPAILKMAGRPTQPDYAEAELAEPVRSDGRRTYVRVTLHREGDRLIASTTGSQGSNVIMSMVTADGLLVLPEGLTEAPTGSRFPVRVLQPVKQQNT